MPESDRVLRLYAIVRSDLGMGAGKAASQAGHAYLGAFLHAVAFVGLSGPGVVSAPQVLAQAKAYAAETPGTKVCLQSDLSRLLVARDKCLCYGLPHFLVVDSGCQNFHGGAPIVTALGIGPVDSRQAKPVVGQFRLHQ